MLLGAGALASVAFVLLASRVNGRETSHKDGRIRSRIPKRRRKATRSATTALGWIGKRAFDFPAATGLALYTHPRSRAGAAVILLSAPLADGVSMLFERYMPHRAPPPGRHEPSNPSFPSGHSLRTTTLTLTTAYVLLRERHGSSAIIAPVAALVPLLTGAGRLYLDRHWGTDVVGGWLAGTALAALCAAGYELMED